MEILGTDVLLHIFSHLDAQSLCSCSQVCKQWYEVSTISSLWKMLVFQQCRKRNIRPHLGRAETWKERFFQLHFKCLYRRSSQREFLKPSYDELEKSLKRLERERYVILYVKAKNGIREFVKMAGFEYRLGNAYYEHTKSETISQKKRIILQDKASGSIYESPAAREMVGLGKGMQDWNIQPGPTGDAARHPQGAQHQ
ncbi:F-box protein SNE [Nematostella vectensis]|uniref:F-box protein SNE n=1 Tax=Nematostella vectensis TaxID=45351 RepID=UPI0020777688|nr:F-box protein SNE [Nematostella vectensis]